MNKKYVIPMAMIFCIALVSAIVLLQVETTLTISPGLELEGDSVEDTAFVGGNIFTTNDLKVISTSDNVAPIDIVTTHTTECDVEDTENFLLDNSAGTCANYPAEGWREECEKRIVIDVDMSLSELETISWNANVIDGYATHADVSLDNGKALTFEYATIDSDCNAPATYPTGEINTFGDMGIIDVNAYAWTDLPGACGDEAFDAQHLTLADWKTTYPTAKITKIEVEIDNWISSSNSEVKNILVNGNEIDINLAPGSELKFNVESQYELLCDGEDTVSTNVVERK